MYFQFFVAVLQDSTFPLSFFVIKACVLPFQYQILTQKIDPRAPASSSLLASGWPVGNGEGEGVESKPNGKETGKRGTSVAKQLQIRTDSSCCSLVRQTLNQGHETKLIVQGPNPTEAMCRIGTGDSFYPNWDPIYPNEERLASVNSSKDFVGNVEQVAREGSQDNPECPFNEV